MQLLNLVTGNLDRPGGVMLTRPAVDVVGRRAGRPGPPRRVAQPGPRPAGVRRHSGELPVATLADEILTPGEGQVRALLTVAGNPVSSTPDGKRLGEAIAGLDFVAAVDIYVNETTRHADVILPPTSALERDHYDLVFHALAVRNTARFTPALFDKPEGSMHDWEIYREIVLRTQPAAAREATAQAPAGAGRADAALPDPDHRPAAAHRQGAAVGAQAARRPGRPRARSSPACPSG